MGAVVDDCRRASAARKRTRGGGRLSTSRYQPSPFIRASLLLHAGAAAAAAAWPELWKVSTLAVAGNHAALTTFGLIPRSAILGHNITRLPDTEANQSAVAITIDDGPHPVATPRVLDILDEYDAKATFFCIGEHVLNCPDIAQEIVRRGHRIENHSMHHLHTFSVPFVGRLRREVIAAQDAIYKTTGQLPRFFRAPAGLRNFLLDRVLQRSDLQLASWTRRGFDTVDTDAVTVVKRLVTELKPRDILLMHDCPTILPRAGIKSPTSAPILEALPQVLQNLRAHALSAVTLHEAIPPVA